MSQDMAPKGGYPAIQTTRNLPKRGPSGFALLAGGAAVFFIGMIRINQGRTARSNLKQEKTNARAAIAPFLDAENDRRYIKRSAELLEAEALIMKDVPGWKVGERVYNTDRFIPPQEDYHLC
eukprot:m.74793 g.74793  ORF g.74793 m.74793 type:complete len:122 (+) comp12413_c0_seq1:226-591(+)